MKPSVITLHKFALLIVILLLPATYIVYTQDVASFELPLFQSDETLDMTLDMDIRKVLKDIGDNRNQHPAELSYLSQDGDTLKLPVRIQTRGHFRRDPMNCDFPPLRLNFSEKEAMNTIFEGQDKIKIITHCRSKGTQYEQNVLKEYLVYRLYNLFTDESYRVRLSNLTYSDTRGKRDTIFKMAFLLEPTEQMAARIHGKLVEIKNVQQVQCDSLKTIRLSVFQYMVGNTDWSVPVPHNVDLVQYKPGVPPVVVPFDFDWCGLVDAPYAVPAENLGISDVKTRIYRGLCREEADFERVFQEFRDKKEEVFQTIESVSLDDKELENVLLYVEQFYSTLDDPALIKIEFYDACRTP